ncbi:glycosyltransferase [Candidatus Roizmanbacteria bacterium]|nr:glycosyltransferase [Candidatus Roizmanbacteria bacterium]
MSFKHKVSVIITTRNGLIFLRSCLPTITKQIYKNIEIVIGDNNSTDGIEKYLAKYYPRIKFYKNYKDYGFAKANNIAAKAATGFFLFFINNDTELFPDTITNLVKEYEDNTILTAYQIPARNKRLQGRVGGGMDIFGYPYHDANTDETKLFYADGAAIFIKRKDFIKIGLFDEKLYMFQEDIDFSWRAQMMGYKIKPVTLAKLYHYYGGTAPINLSEKSQYVSSTFRRYQNERNVIRNILKNYSLPFVLMTLPLLTILHLIEIFFFAIQGKFSVANCYLRAYFWNAIQLKNTLQTRKIIQRKRLISDGEIIKRLYITYSKVNMVFRLKKVPTFT